MEDIQRTEIQGRHSRWAITLFGKKEDLLEIWAEGKKVTVGTRVYLIEKISGIEYGSTPYNDGRFPHLHAMVKVCYRKPCGKEVIDSCRQNAIRDALVSHSPKTSLPYCAPVKSVRDWIGYINKSKASESKVIQFINHLLDTGSCMTDDAIIGAVGESFGIDLATKFQGNRLTAVKAVHARNSAPTIHYVNTPQEVFDSTFEFINNCHVDVNFLGPLTDNQAKVFFTFMYVCVMYIPRLNQPDCLGGIFLTGPPASGKSTLFANADVHIIPTDAKGVGKFKSSAKVFCIDDVTPTHFQTNVTTFRGLTLGQKIGVKNHGGTGAVVGKWVVMTSNETLTACCEHDQADLRRYMVVTCKPIPTAQQVTMFCDQVKLKKLWLDNMVDVFEGDLWKTAPFASHPYVSYYADKIRQLQKVDEFYF